MRRAGAIALAAGLIAAGPAVVPGSGFAGASGARAGDPEPPAAGCETAADPAGFTSSKSLRRQNRRMYDFGQRLTGSPAHKRYLRWLAGRLEGIDGLRLESTPYEIKRWLERDSSLSVAGPGARPTDLPVAGAVPYSHRTGPGGAGGQLVYVPQGEEITADRAAGKIVVRDSVPGAVPNAAFGILQWTSYDPDGTLTAEAGGTYERDYLSYDDRIDDLEAAAAAGAAGVVFVLDFPTEQMRGHYEPYEGLLWGVPGVFVGAAEGSQLKSLAAEGGSARMRISASVERTSTPHLTATLPGASRQRIVVETHTDGINALQENGAMALLAMAKHFAELPRECRPRTLEFSFSTAHLHQVLVPGERNGSAWQQAEEFDREYDGGSLAVVIAIEHLGARGYTAVPNSQGAGRTLEPAGLSEPYAVFVSDSPTLVNDVDQNLRRHELERTLILQGADLAGPTIPPHQSFGGEGTPYNRHILPTIGAIAGPWSLYNPSFGMEAVDSKRMRDQTIFFTDLVHTIMPQPRADIAGAIPEMRAARDAICAGDPSGGGVTQCKGEPR